jgi:protein-tyrosine phosphatase
MAEAFLRSRTETPGLAISVASAGFMMPDQPAPKQILEVMARRGIDMSHHRSRDIIDALVEPPELIVGMDRQHVRGVADLDPSLLGRTFTLKELVRLGEEEGPRGLSEPVADYLERIGDGRSVLGLARKNKLDDVEDPIGRWPGRFEEAAQEIEGLVDRLLAVVWPNQSLNDGQQDPDDQPATSPAESRALEGT